MTVFSIDDAGLFSRIAGAVASTGVNIGARIATCSMVRFSMSLSFRPRRMRLWGSRIAPATAGKCRGSDHWQLSGKLDAQRAVATDAKACPPYAGAVTCDLSNKTARPTVMKSMGGIFPDFCIRSRKLLRRWVCRSNPRRFPPMANALSMCFMSRSVWSADPQ